MKEPDLFRKLLGTSGCWFLFDVMFYGNTIFQPVVLSAAFGPAETVSKVAQDTLLINAMAFPGYLASIVLIGRQSPKFVQAQGFLLVGFIYTAIGSFFGELAGNRCLLLGGYGASFFFSNYGPNSTVRVLRHLRRQKIFDKFLTVSPPLERYRPTCFHPSRSPKRVDQLSTVFALLVVRLVHC
jgi:PHS family inorganic phosphate transporter-like MFS transporter